MTELIMKKSIRRITACIAALVCAVSAALSGVSPSGTLVQAAQTQWHFDFGGGGAANGYTAVEAGTDYSRSTGYGFANTSQRMFSRSST